MRNVEHRCAFRGSILFPMRIRDFSRFGFTEELFPGQDLGDD